MLNILHIEPDSTNPLISTSINHDIIQSEINRIEGEKEKVLNSINYIEEELEFSLNDIKEKYELNISIFEMVKTCYQKTSEFSMDKSFEPSFLIEPNRYISFLNFIKNKEQAILNMMSKENDDSEDIRTFRMLSLHIKEFGDNIVRTINLTIKTLNSLLKITSLDFRLYVDKNFGCEEDAPFTLEISGLDHIKTALKEEILTAHRFLYNLIVANHYKPWAENIRYIHSLGSIITRPGVKTEDFLKLQDSFNSILKESGNYKTIITNIFKKNCLQIKMIEENIYPTFLKIRESLRKRIAEINIEIQNMFGSQSDLVQKEGACRLILDNFSAMSIEESMSMKNSSMLNTIISKVKSNNFSIMAGGA